MRNQVSNSSNFLRGISNVSQFEPSVSHVIISSVQATVIFLGTSISLLAFATEPGLRTPFNYYLISTLASELLLSLYQIFVVIQAYYGYWPFSVRACTCVAFLFFFGLAIASNAHFLISVNRTWALFFPHHYRINNSKTVTVVLCCSLWVGSLLLILPWAVLNEPFLKEPILLCRIQPYDQYAFSCFIMIFFILATVYVIGIYPVLYFKYRSRKRVGASLTAKKLRRSLQDPPVLPSQKRGSNGTIQDKQSIEKTSQLEESGRKDHPANDPRPKQPNLVIPRRVRRGKPIFSNSFLVLTWVAFCAMLFWTPNVIYAVTELFLHPKPCFNNMTYVNLCVWLEVATCLDPLVFIITVPPLRAQIKKLLDLKM